MSCLGCPNRYIGPSRSGDDGIVLIGTSPGQKDRPGYPFSGYAARDLDYYLLPKVTRVGRDAITVTNVVGCVRDQDALTKDVTVGQACAARHLPDQIGPDTRVVAVMGAYANRVLGVTDDLERDHGIVRQDFRIYNWTGPVVPVLHPAQAAHDAYILGELTEDFKVIREVAAGIHVPMREFPTIWVTEMMPIPFESYVGPIAIDTETIDDKPICLSVCLGGYRGYVIRVNDLLGMGAFRALISDSTGPIILHNSTFDIAELATMGIDIPRRRVVDTMLLAYHQGYGSAAASTDGGTYGRGRQSLKYLAWRLLRLPMTEYKDLIRPHYDAAVATWLCGLESPPDIDAHADQLTKLGNPRKPKMVAHPITKQINKLVVSPEPAKLYAGWDEEKRTGIVPPPTADLSLVPWPEIVQYAGTDAIATFWLYHALRRKRRIRPLF